MTALNERPPVTGETYSMRIADIYLIYSPSYLILPHPLCCSMCVAQRGMRHCREVGRGSPFISHLRMCMTCHDVCAHALFVLSSCTYSLRLAPCCLRSFGFSSKPLPCCYLRFRLNFASHVSVLISIFSPFPQFCVVNVYGL